MPKRSWVLLLATWLLVALMTKTSPESAHEFSRLGTVDSIVERGTYQLDDSIFIGTLDKVFRNGHFYSHQPPPLATLEAPVYWGDVIPAGFHHELFNYPGSVFDESSLSGSLKHHSLQALGGYAWQALFAGKGYFTFAPVLGLGLIVGVAGWTWWARARGVQLVLLGGVATSLVVSLLMTNNFGGGAVGFRHATYLAPAMLTLLLPVLVDRRPATRAGALAVATVGGISVVVLLRFSVRDPWSSLSLPPGPVGPWETYVPMVAKVAKGELFKPY
jgi:hypothetical protein